MGVFAEDYATETTAKEDVEFASSPNESIRLLSSPVPCRPLHG